MRLSRAEAVICVMIICTFTVRSASAQTVSAPTLLRIEGVLNAPAGEPRTGQVVIVVSLYAEQQDVTALWFEEQVVTLSAYGRYAFVMGATQPEGVPKEFFLATAERPARWIGVAAQGEPEHNRFMIVSVPYASRALEADTLGGKSVTDFILADPTSTTESTRTTTDAGSEGAVTSVAGVANALAKYTGSGTTQDSANIYDVFGAIGINTAFPTQNLDVNGVIRTNSTLSAARNITIGNVAGDLIADFYNQSASGYGALYRTAANDTTRYGLQVRGATSRVDFTVLSNGNVGIGTEAPSGKLHVAGNVVVDGNIGAKYQDLAEWVETPVPLEAGTVVIIDPSQTNRVVPTTRAYDTRVAGAVSHQPGLLLGESGENKVMIAHTGRVRVKADASFGAIKIGDLIVTSPTAGYAMRSKPIRVAGQQMHRPGTVLGKALEALPAGKGEILVLISLQ